MTTNQDISLLESDLTQTWHFQHEATYRENLKTIWSTVDQSLTVLDQSTILPSRPRNLLNKATSVYFEQSAQYGYYNDDFGYPYISRIFIATIFEAWRDRCIRGNGLDFEFGRFLAHPIRITKRGPRSLREIVTAHRGLCDIVKRTGTEVGDENYGIPPTYPAVILVFDREVFESGVVADAKDDDGLINLRKLAQEMTVLVIRTQASDGVDVPLDDLESHSLPLERPDAEGIDVRRVPLSVAVDFVMKLEERNGGSRQRNMRPAVYDHFNLSRHAVPDGFDPIVRTDPAMWAAAWASPGVRRDTAAYILNDVGKALLRINAHAVGEQCDFELEHEEWNRRWKPGYD